MIKYLALFFLFFVFSNQIFAQANDTISNPEKIYTTDILDVISKIHEIYLTSPNEAINLSNQVISSSRKISYSQGIGDGYKYLGLIAYHQNKYDLAITNFKSAYSYYHSNHEKSAADVIYNIASCYSYLGDGNRAITYYKQVLKAYQKLHNAVGIADTYTNMAIMYDNLGEYELAMDYYFKAYDLNKHNGRKEQLGADLNNLGQFFETIKLHEKAKEYLERSIEAASAINDSSTLFYTYQSLGNVYLNEGKIDEALKFLRKSLTFIKQIDSEDYGNLSLVYADMAKAHLQKGTLDSTQYYLNSSFKSFSYPTIPFNQAYALLYQAKLYNVQENFKLAQKTAEEGLAIADDINSISLKINLQNELKNAYANQYHYKEAYDIQEQGLSLKRKINTGLVSKKIITLLLTKDYENKENAQKTLKEKADLNFRNKLNVKNIIIIIMVLIAVLASVICILLYLNHKKQKSANQLLLMKNSEISENRSEIKSQALALKELNEIKDKLFTIISHDLRRPINQLSSIIDLLEINLMSREEMEEIIPFVSKSVQDTSDLLDNLLFWAKSQMQGFELKITETNLKNFIDEKLKEVLTNSLEKDVKLVNEIPPYLTVKIDEHLLAIILRNLVSNAIKFSHPGEDVVLKYKEDTGFHIITVKDSGAGMTTQQLEELFTPKVKSTKGTRNETGSGLGLIFSKDLVEKSGGSIWVKSEPDKGSEFSFSMPKA